MATWLQLTNAIRASGRFDRSAIMEIAVQRARRERDAFAAMGLPQAWAVLLAYELRLAWQVAKTAMDGVIAARLAEALTPAERAARVLELRAEIALSAFPPRDGDAAELRALAAGIRAEAAQRCGAPACSTPTAAAGHEAPARGAA